MLRTMTRERFLSDLEAQRLMAAARSRRHVHRARDHAFLALLLNTGIRPSEALALTRADLFLGARPPWMRIERLKKRKAAPEVSEIELPRGVAAALRLHLRGVATGRVFAFSRRQALTMFKRYARLAGIHGRPLYVLRHTAATRFYVDTRDITIVQAMLGHENPSTSAIYAHIPRTLLADFARTFPALT